MRGIKASIFVVLLAVPTSVGCSSAPARARVEASARSLAPVPACVSSLPRGKAAPAGMRQTLRDEYWQIIFPGFDTVNHRLPDRAVSCTGRWIFDDAIFTGAQVVEPADETEITFGGGADGIKALWLRSHRTKDGATSGALALVRVEKDSISVFGVGVYQGQEKAKLSLERLGNELVLLVNDDGCTGRSAADRCDSTMTVFLLRQGKLVPGAKISLERVDFGTEPENLHGGALVYHLKTAASFVKSELRLMEQVSVRDMAGRELRKAEFERVYQLDDSTLLSSDDALWGRMFRK